MPFFASVLLLCRALVENLPCFHLPRLSPSSEINYFSARHALRARQRVRFVVIVVVVVDVAVVVVVLMMTLLFLLFLLLLLLLLLLLF